MSNYNKIRKMDISNGPGVRVSIFMQGCTFNCKNCFNPETHDFNGGLPFDESVISNIIELCKPDFINGLSILGGEPLHIKNIESTYLLSKKFKEAYPTKTVWVWSGFTYEKLDKKYLEYIDVLVDGQFKEELKNITLKYMGSSNQRVIDVKKSLEKGEVVLYKEEVTC